MVPVRGGGGRHRAGGGAAHRLINGRRAQRQRHDGPLPRRLLGAVLEGRILVGSAEGPRVVRAGGGVVVVVGVVDVFVPVGVDGAAGAVGDGRLELGGGLGRAVAGGASAEAEGGAVVVGVGDGVGACALQPAPVRRVGGCARQLAGGIAVGDGASPMIAHQRAPLDVRGGAGGVDVAAGVAGRDGDPRADLADEPARGHDPAAGRRPCRVHHSGREAGPDHRAGSSRLTDEPARVHRGGGSRGGADVGSDVGPGVAGRHIRAGDQARQTAGMERAVVGELHGGADAAGAVAAHDLRLAPAGQRAHMDIGGGVAAGTERDVHVGQPHTAHHGGTVAHVGEQPGVGPGGAVDEQIVDLVVVADEAGGVLRAADTADGQPPGAAVVVGVVGAVPRGPGVEVEVVRQLIAGADLVGRRGLVVVAAHVGPGRGEHAAVVGAVVVLAGVGVVAVVV